MSFVVYVLHSASKVKIYIGYTSDLINRMKSQNHFGKNDYTSKFRPLKVEYLEFFEIKSEVLKREKQLKSANGRKFIHEQIASII